MDIQVILTADDPKLGKRGQVVKVSSGYAQNFLFPNRKAEPATDSNLKLFKQEKDRRDKESAEVLAKARATADEIRKVALRIESSAGDGEKLFGAVTAQDIAEALSRYGVTLDKKKIHMPEAVKKLGTHEAEIKLHPEVHLKLRFEVVKRS